MRRIIIVLVIAILGMGGYASATKLETEPKKVTICHHTSSETNPWVRTVVNEHATNGHFDNNGTTLAGHEGDLLLLGEQDCPTEPTPPDTPPVEAPVVQSVTIEPTPAFGK